MMVIYLLLVRGLMKVKMKKVFLCGTFDLLHEGHIQFLKNAKAKGDILYVFVISDNYVFKFKGKFSKENQEKRISKLKKLGFVDKVVALSDSHELNFKKIADLKPDVFVFGYDQSSQFEERVKKYLLERDLDVDYCKFTEELAEGIHTSDLIKKSVNKN